MKITLKVISVWILMAVLTLPMSHQSVAAAPAGDLTILSQSLGNQVPLPAVEIGLAIDYMKLLYDPLVGTTPDGRLSAQNGLAKKWEMTPDGLTWTFYLREGIKFHDGAEVTAKDVKFTIEKIATLPEASQGSFVRGTVKSVDIKGPYILVINCKKPSLFLTDLFSDSGGCTGLVLHKDYYERVGKEQFTRHPIGSGPYKWHSQMIGSFIKLESVGKHWRDGVPQYKSVSFRLIPEESTSIAMLKTGEGDITLISRDRFKGFLKDADLNMIIRKNASHVIFHPNMQWESPVFSDIRFRKALNLAIDKEAVIKHIFAGMATPLAQHPGINIFTCGGDPSLKPYPYAPDEARRLIKEGGYEGYEFAVPNYPRPGVSEFPRLVETITGYWQKIGLKPKIFMTEWTAFRDSWRANKIPNTVNGYDSTNSAGCGDMVMRLREKLFSKADRIVVRIPELDAMFNKAERSMDLAEVEELMGKVYRYVYDQYLMVPICHLNDVIATTKRIPQWDPGLRRFSNNLNEVIRER